MYEVLEKIPYEIIKKDPQQKITKLTKFKNHSYLPDGIRKSCYPPPRLFGQIKNRKKDKAMPLLVAK